MTNRHAGVVIIATEMSTGVAVSIEVVHLMLELDGKKCLIMLRHDP